MIGKSIPIIEGILKVTMSYSGSGRSAFKRKWTNIKAIRSWDSEKKSRLLQFTTGTSRVPVNGFKDLQGSDGPRRFTIEKAGDVSQLPKAHTWYPLAFLHLISVSIVLICHRISHMINLWPSFPSR